MPLAHSLIHLNEKDIWIFPRGLPNIDYSTNHILFFKLLEGCPDIVKRQGYTFRLTSKLECLRCAYIYVSLVLPTPTKKKQKQKQTPTSHKSVPPAITRQAQQTPHSGIVKRKGRNEKKKKDGSQDPFEVLKNEERARERERGRRKRSKVKKEPPRSLYQLHSTQRTNHRNWRGSTAKGRKTAETR